MQLDFLESAMNVSRRQSAQSLESSFPVSAEYFPGGQSLHPDTACTPVADEYVPAGQSSHVVAEYALKELLHLPARHNMHSVLSDLAYLPASQAVHGAAQGRVGKSVIPRGPPDRHAATPAVAVA